GLVGERTTPSSMLVAPGKGTDWLIGEDAERVGGKERSRVVPLEVEPPDAIVPAERHGAPVEWDFGVGIERTDVRPSLPGIDGRVADGGEVGIRGIARPCIVGITGHGGLGCTAPGRAFWHGSHVRRPGRTPHPTVIYDITTAVSSVMTQGQL